MKISDTESILTMKTMVEEQPYSQFKRRAKLLQCFICTFSFASKTVLFSPILCKILLNSIVIMSTFEQYCLPPHPHVFSPIKSTRGPKTKLTLSDQTDQITLPPYCKTCFSTSEWIWHAKNTWSNYKRSGIWVDPPPVFFQNSHIFPFFWKTSLMLQIVGLSRISGTVPVRHCRQSSLLCISCLKESTAFLFADARACTLAPVKSTVMVAPPPISSPAEHTGGSPLGGDQDHHWSLFIS